MTAELGGEVNLQGPPLAKAPREEKVGPRQHERARKRIVASFLHLAFYQINRSERVRVPKRV